MNATSKPEDADVVQVSVVAPLRDESACVEELHRRLAAVLDANGAAWEIVFVDDGSRDGTGALLREVEASDPRVRVLELTRSFGQMSALVAGLEQARGGIVVTMDGDLQDPPEEIPRLLECLRPDVDLVCASRIERHQSAWRRLGGSVVHFVARRLTGVDLEDFGGQFRAYRRQVVDATLAVWSEGRPFFPLALWLGFRVAEVRVRHDPRRRGESRYGLLQLALLNLDLITSFTTAPLLWMFATGAAVAAGAAAAAATGLLPRPAWSLALVLGALLASSGLVGLYVARLYRPVAGGRRLHVVRRGPASDRNQPDRRGSA